MCETLCCKGHQILPEFSHKLYRKAWTNTEVLMVHKPLKTGILPKLKKANNLKEKLGCNHENMQTPCYFLGN